MFVLIKCKKYHRPSVRVVDFGDTPIAEGFAKFCESSYECPICGPCSHVEFGYQHLWSIVSTHENRDDAVHELDQLQGSEDYCSY
jgi:hypothetical protein